MTVLNTDYLLHAICSIRESLVEKGLLHAPLTAGNISVLDSRANILAITAKGQDLNDPELTPVIVELNDQFEYVGHFAGQPSTELPMHLAAYKACRGRPTAVVHLHSLYATTFSCIDLPYLPFFHYQQILLGSDRVPIVPFALPGSAELAFLVTSAFREHRVKALLLANHGALVAGKPAEVADLADVLENSCTMALLPRTVYLKEIPEKTIQSGLKALYRDYFPSGQFEPTD